VPDFETSNSRLGCLSRENKEVDLATVAADSRVSLQEEVNRLQWVHQIDLGNGVVTPGAWGRGNPAVWKAFDDVDFHGKKVLDIGCWDGLYSFEAERRGASKVYATDLVSQRAFTEHPTFLLARDILKSNVKYFPNLSVYDVETLGVSDFDVVIYAGVYYHLRDPLRSFAKLRRVMKDGGTIVVEGAAIPGSHECCAKFHYEEHYFGDPSNWWIPTIPCLRQWVECNFFEVERTYDVWDGRRLRKLRTALRRFAGLRKPKTNARCTLTARAVRRPDPHYTRPDEDLAEFDLNEYPENYYTRPQPR
jgi:tRNA (mo5U34)-methyltransferase